MKKLIVTTLTLLTCGAVYALPVGNPSEASLFSNGVWCGSNECCDPCDPCFSWCDAWGFRIGFYGDYVFDRNLQIDGDGVGIGKNIFDTEIYTNAAYIAVNLCDRLDVFATLGATRIEVFNSSATWITTGTGNPMMLLRAETDFSWSVGARATLWNWNCFSFGAEGQYFRTSPELTSLTNYFNGVIQYFNDNNETKYEEWQIGFGISYAVTTSCPKLAMVPYAAVKWSGVRWDTDNFTFLVPNDGTPNTIFKMEEDKNWGYAIGMTFAICDMAGVTVEGRWADEKAVYVNGQIRF